MKTVSFCLCAMALLFAIPVIAQTTTATSATSTAVETEIVSQQTTNSPTPSAERVPGLNERAQERVINLAANMSNRFDAVISRLFQISDRLDSRIVKLEQTGQDTVEARAFLVTAQTSLRLAQSNMSDIDQLVVQFAASTNPSEQWSEVKTRYVETRALVRSAHADMRAVIQVLKEPPIIATEAEEISN